MKCLTMLRCDRYSELRCCPDVDQSDRFQTLILAARQHPRESRERNRYLTQLIRELSPLLWRADTSHYADAQQQMWRFFVERGIDTYNPASGSLVSWLNSHLWYRHQDLVRQAAQRQCHERAIAPAAEIEQGYPATIRDLPAPEYGSLEMLEQVRQWVETDAEQQLRRIRLRDRPQVNAQILILLRLPAETPWKQISAQFQVAVPTLSSFYRRNCLPPLRQFGQAQGFL
jgi:hypothetical protein